MDFPDDVCRLIVLSGLPYVPMDDMPPAIRDEIKLALSPKDVYGNDAIDDVAGILHSELWSRPGDR